MRPSIRPFLFLVPLAVSFAACGDGGTAPIVNGPDSLVAATWYINTVGDSAPGATVAVRLIGAAQERTVLDSGQLYVSALGSYEQRYWLRVFVNGVLDRSETVVDQGSWSLGTDNYRFRSTIRTRDFFVTPASGGRLLSSEALVFYVGAPTSAVVYRSTRP